MAATPVLPAAFEDATGTSEARRGGRPPGIVAWLVVALSGVVSAAVIPRGPVTGAQVIVLISAATAVGALTGWCVRSRWAILAAPVLHVVAWEITRATVFRLDGPTFGWPR